MDIPTRNLGNYVKEKGINLSKMSRDTGIAYSALYDSLLNPKRNRDLKAGEMFEICDFLGLSLNYFADGLDSRGGITFETGRKRD